MCEFCNGHEVDMFFAPRGIVLLVIICMYCNLLGGKKKKKENCQMIYYCLKKKFSDMECFTKSIGYYPKIDIKS